MPALGRVSWWDFGSDSQVGCICGRKGRAVTAWLCLQPSASAVPQVQAWEGGWRGSSLPKSSPTSSPATFVLPLSSGGGVDSKAGSSRRPEWSWLCVFF